MEVGSFISFRGLRAEVKYVGALDGKEGTFVGIELEKPAGKNNGSFKGKKYFECKEKHGIIAKIDEIMKLSKILPDDQKLQKSQSQVLELPQKTPLKTEEKSPLTTPTDDKTPQKAKELKVKIETPKNEENENENENTKKEDPIPLISPSPSTVSISQSCTSFEQQNERRAKYNSAIETLTTKISQFKNKTATLQKLHSQKEEERKTKLKTLAAEIAKRIMKKQIESEEILLKKESEGLEEAKKVLSMTEASDEKTALRKLSLLQQVNEQHIRYQDNLDQLLNAQKVNLSVSMQATEALKKKIARTKRHAKERELTINKLKTERQQREDTLSQKKPDWKDISAKKAEYEKAQKAVTEEKMQQKIIEVDSIVNANIISEIVKDHPLVLLVMYVKLLMAKAESISKHMEISKRKEIEMLLHICDTLILTLAGFISSVEPVPELIKEIKIINEKLDKDELLNIDTEKIKQLVQSMSSIDLGDTLTRHLIFHYASIEDDDDVSENYISVAEKLTKIIHPILLPKELAVDVNTHISPDLTCIDIKSNFSVDKLLYCQSQCKDISLDINDFFSLKENANEKEKQKLDALKKQEKEKLKEKVRKAEQERDILCARRKELSEMVNSKQKK